jgi:hypothetical protein
MKHSLFTLLLALFCATAWAQPGPPPGDRDERIQAYRIAVYTEVLQLTPDEAQNFWPLYNEYTDKREALQRELRAGRQIDAMSDAEVETYIQKFYDVRQRELDLEKELGQKLRKVLPARKIAKLPMAEREFREALVKKLQEARENRQGKQRNR